jgi:hypothetical protein
MCSREKRILLEQQTKQTKSVKQKTGRTNMKSETNTTIDAGKVLASLNGKDNNTWRA